MPPKKKAAGDAAKGEKLFKNLCAVCHSMAVSLTNLSYCTISGSWNWTKFERYCRSRIG